MKQSVMAFAETMAESGHYEIESTAGRRADVSAAGRRGNLSTSAGRWRGRFTGEIPSVAASLERPYLASAYDWIKFAHGWISSLLVGGKSGNVAIPTLSSQHRSRLCHLRFEAINA